ncbi:hypothetical protein KEU06_09275 [Pseudaminobacter sp. 19-2017]|uniref:Uncharacterized protein n=1 Tax=Pseudaminobacter soli (ex Zhang et al. 2022) TaxID=2831468 RepID=A0A942E1B9_9HYPH|nr:hypothetical protein [Pseudaminobacter soli]MBS3648795.1 hypothetical protein [Pseudaminobacter soli]
MIVEWDKVDADYLRKVLAENDPAAFRKLYLCEPVPEPFPEVYWFFAPSFRVAEAVLWSDYDIHPKLPIIKIVTKSIDSLRSLKAGSTVTMFDDPEFSERIRMRDREEFWMLGRYRGWRNWDKRDRDYLRALTRQG